MNKFIGVGRLTRDPEIRYVQGGEGEMAVARYTLAIDRMKRANEQSADFLSCVAFGKNAEFAEKYLRQGMKIIIQAHVQSGSYTNKEGLKVYTVDFAIETQEFAESKAVNEQAGGRPDPAAAAGDGFMNVPDGVEDEGLPFN